MPAVAVLSTGPASDSESCRTDVLNFLQMLPSRLASVEVKRWSFGGLHHAVRKWETVTTDLESLAQEIAQFITGGEVEAGATVLVRRSTG
jgi:hypothetical protein